MDNMLKEYIEKLKLVDTVEEYEEFISKLHQMMKQETYKNDIVQNIRNKQKYMVNKFSKESTRENMLKAICSKVRDLYSVQEVSMDD